MSTHRQHKPSMLRLSPTVICLSPADIEHVISPSDSQPAPINLLTTSLRAEATAFTPEHRAESPADLAGDSFPTPSPQLDRYPVLVRPPRERRSTTRSRTRPSLEHRHTPSPQADVARARHESIERLSGRLRQRASSDASRHGKQSALQFELSPLDQLMNELRLIRDIYPPSRSQSRQSDERAGAEESPTSITISRVPSHDYPPIQHFTDEQHLISARREPPAAYPSMDSENNQALSASARRRVQIYHDSPFSIHNPHTPANMHRQRPAVPEEPVASPGEARRDSLRHTFAQHETGGHGSAYMARRQQENDEHAQIASYVGNDQRTRDMSITPPARPPYERYPGQTFF